MNVELIHKILSTSRVRQVEPDHFQFDFGYKIPANEFDSLGTCQEALGRLCERPEFTTAHLAELLTLIGD